MIRQIFLSVVFSLAIGMGGLIGTWLFDRDRPLEIHYTVFHDLTISENENYTYDRAFTRNRFCHAMVDRWFVDNDGKTINIVPIPYAMSTKQLNVREKNAIVIDEVPYAKMSRGPATFAFRPKWKCNPLHYIPFTLDFMGIFGIGPIIGPEESFPLYIDKPEEL